LKREEELLHLKSRSLWFQNGNKNTKHFHNQAKIRQRRNNVSKITLEYGTVITDFTKIKIASNSHFFELCIQQNDASQDNIVSMLEHIPSLIFNDENLELTLPISENDIHLVVWSLDPDKAPGPNGFSISFYHFLWELIKTDLKKKMIHYSHQSLCLGGSTNSCFLSLIPKDSNPSL
jgi:hypothetical protein